MIGGLIEEQDVGRRDERGRNREPLLPSTGERRGWCTGVLEFGPA